VERFQNDEIDVLICSTIAAKEGLTLTQADTVLFVEREWVPAYEEQAEDRVNRIGQDNDTVWAVYLSIRDTVDARFAALVEGKRRLIKSIVDGGEVGTRNQIINELLQDMVESGELPFTMLQDLTGGTA
jgi:SNF2 family DNA or RNA helicase